MRQYHTELRETKETIKIICNRCGKEITVTKGLPEEVVLEVEKRWGYFSEKDGQTDRFDLCEACYDEWVDGFLIPIERSE